MSRWLVGSSISISSGASAEALVARQQALSGAEEEWLVLEEKAGG
ncbi:hypothetical protein [Mangrovicoccus ximenensis]|nr:hypothetical protein [Mangrovicoccus ximenensis]